MDLKDIQNLIKFVAKSGASEVKLETEDVKITIKTGSETETTYVQQMPMAAQMPQMAIPAQQPVASTTAAEPAAAPAKKIQNTLLSSLLSLGHSTENHHRTNHYSLKLVKPLLKEMSFVL